MSYGYMLKLYKQICDWFCVRVLSPSIKHLGANVAAQISSGRTKSTYGKSEHLLLHL